VALSQGTVESVGKKKTASPYLVSQLADHERSMKGSRSARVQPRESARAARQASHRDAMPRSISARLPETMHHSSSEGEDSPLGVSSGPSSQPRSQSTQPNTQWETSPSKTAGRTSFPRLAQEGDASARRNEADRPRTEADGKSDDKFAQLENWIDDKIKNLLGDSVNISKSEPPNTNVRMREVDEQGIRRELDSCGHVLSTSPTDDGERAALFPEVNSGKGQRRPSIQRRGSQDDVEDQENVSRLLGRLKKTINTDQQQRQEGMPTKNKLKSSSFKGGSEGFQLKDSKELEKNKQSNVANNTGRTVSQDADADALNDERDMRARKGTLMDLETSRAAQSRRGVLEGLEGERTAMSPKTPKRVGWSLDQQEVEYENLGDWDGNADIFRPETGTTARSSRPTTGISTLAPSRPETSNTHPDLEDADPDPNDPSQPDAAKQIPKFTESEFYTWVQHNKLAEVEVALVQGHDADKRDKHGNTPLMLACQNGHKRMVKLCLKFGAEPNKQNHQGNTPLHFCIAYGFKEVAEYLVSKGADDTIMNNFGRAAAEGKLH